MSIGARIKDLREQKGYSQTDFAHLVRVSKQTLYKYENDIVTNIPSDKIEEIARALHVSPAYLMGWETKEDYIVNGMAIENNERLTKAMDLYAAYEKAIPEVRAAIEGMLRSTRRDK